MANKLEKLPGVGGGGGPGEGGSHDEGDDSSGGGLPPEGSACRGDMYSAIAQLFPGQPIGSIWLDIVNGKQIVTVGYPGGVQWWITGAECRNGYVQLTYMQAPGIYPQSD